MKKLYMLAGGGVGAIVVFGLLFTWIVSGGIDSQSKLEIATRLLNDDNWAVAGRIARELSHEEVEGTPVEGAWHYVSGVSIAKSMTDDYDSPRNRRLLKEAKDHLEKANEVGFPIGYQGKGRFYLGWCYFHTYDWDGVTESLKGVEKSWPERRSDSLKMIVEAHIRKNPQEFADAKKNLKLWESIPGLSKSEQARIQLAKTQMAFLQGNFAACEELLQKIDSETPEHLQGQLWLGRCNVNIAQSLDEGDQRRAERIQRALTVIRPMVLAAEKNPAVGRQAMYLYGRILRLQGKNKDAIATFSSIRQDKPQSAEAVVSGLEEAEIFLDSENLDEAVGTCRLVLRSIEDVALYNGYWVPLSELSERLLNIGKQLRSKGEYDRAILLAGHISEAFPPSGSVRLQAEAYRDWGDFLTAGARSEATPNEGQEYRRLVRSKYHAAGERYEQLARLELKSKDYPEILWQAIKQYQKANELERAARILKEYLAAEEHYKRPRGYLATAKNYMNSGSFAQAVEPLQRCLGAYPGHPILFEVRLLEAKAREELDDLEAATALLEENLFGHDLTPQSEIWRESMTQLGHIRYKQGSRLLIDSELVSVAPEDKLKKLEECLQHFDASIEHLGHAVSEPWDEMDYYEARYAIAKAHKLAALSLKRLITEDPTLVGSTRRDYRNQWKVHLSSALGSFASLREELYRNVDSTSPQQYDSLVRNCYFGEADTLFDLERWNDAVLAYRTTASMYMSRPESLEAFVQMASCYFRQGATAEGKKTLAMAEQVLSRIPTEYDPQFELLTRAGREEWKTILTRLQAWN